MAASSRATLWRRSSVSSDRRSPRTVPPPMAMTWITMIAPYRNQRSVVGQGNPVMTVLIRIDVAATPTTISAIGRSKAAWKNPLMAKMKNIGLRAISSVASTSSPTK